MMNYLKSLAQRKKEYIKFVLSGTLSWTIEVVIIFVFTEIFGFWYVFSAGLAMTGGYTTSFIMQKFWTFRHGCQKKICREIALYLIVLIISVQLNIHFVHMLVREFRHFYSFHFDYIVAQGFVGAVLGIGNFFFYKYLVFKKDLIIKKRAEINN